VDGPRHLQHHLQTVYVCFCPSVHVCVRVCARLSMRACCGDVRTHAGAAAPTQRNAAGLGGLLAEVWDGTGGRPVRVPSSQPAWHMQRVHGGQAWYMVDRHGTWWTGMVHGGQAWYMVDRHMQRVHGGLEAPAPQRLCAAGKCTTCWPVFPSPLAGPPSSIHTPEVPTGNRDGRPRQAQGAAQLPQQRNGQAQRVKRGLAAACAFTTAHTEHPAVACARPAPWNGPTSDVGHLRL